MAKALDTISEVLPGLFIGSFSAAENLEEQATAGVTHVLCLSEEVPENLQGLTSLHLPMSDWGESPLDQLLVKAVPFIDDAQALAGRILVFCGLGVNRSPALVCGYLVTKGWEMDDALEAISSARPIMSIHKDYLDQLKGLASRWA